MDKQTSLKKQLIRYLGQPNLFRSSQGFTLIELLIVMLISALIITGLLWFVIELSREEQREATLTATDQEMQLALDYIISDLREAVYIYDGECNPLNTNSCPSYNSYVPAAVQLNAPDVIPVLAFWKTAEVDLSAANYANMCDGTTPDSLTNPVTVNSNATALQEIQYQDCQDLFRQRHAYSLVIYVQETTSDAQWPGLSRIKRYELDKYAPEPIGTTNTTMIRSQGYVNPAQVGTSLFATWPLVQSGTTLYNCQSNATGGGFTAGFTRSECGAYNDGTYNATLVASAGVPNATGNVHVLVDFVDAPNAAGFTPTCADTTNYQLVPRNPADDTVLSNSFYACVRNSDDETTPNVDESLGDTQDVIVYLRGNARGRSSVFSNTDSRTNTLQTQLTLRSVLDKDPS